MRECWLHERLLTLWDGVGEDLSRCLRREWLSLDFRRELNDYIFLRQLLLPCLHRWWLRFVILLQHRLLRRSATTKCMLWWSSILAWNDWPRVKGINQVGIPIEVMRALDNLILSHRPERIEVCCIQTLVTLDVFIKLELIWV